MDDMIIENRGDLPPRLNVLDDLLGKKSVSPRSDFAPKA